MKVYLAFPPHWEPMMHHLALPSLAAHLWPNGVEVVQRDLNAEVFDRPLSSALLSGVRLLDRENRCAPHSD